MMAIRLSTRSFKASGSAGVSREKRACREFLRLAHHHSCQSAHPPRGGTKRVGLQRRDTFEDWRTIRPPVVIETATQYFHRVTFHVRGVPRRMQRGGRLVLAPVVRAMGEECLDVQAALGGSSISRLGGTVGRSVTLGAGALGLLRQLLVQRLGGASSIALLTRFGFGEGWRAAEAFVSCQDRPSMRLEEALRVLHLQGLVGVCSSGQMQLPDGTIAVDASCEAEQHLAQYGRSLEPVCWFVGGYLSGFLTRVEGRPILCRERICMAQGHAICRFKVEPARCDGFQMSCVDPTSTPTCDCLVRQLDFNESAPADLVSDGEDPQDLGMHSPRMRRLLRDIDRVAGVDSTVLITGESGAGKERLAQRIHSRSRRASAPFVPVNCGAIADTLWDSELFGHRRGAFTGAMSDRTGLIEAAHRGTLFLDEVGELPLDMQVKLLRALQEREVRRVGDTRATRVDIRVIAATNRDLAADVRTKRFRQDLYYRLHVVRFDVPPLRERPEDLIVLLRTLRVKISSRMGRQIVGYSPAATARLRQYDWPGNIRELENAIERACALAAHDVIDVEDLPEHLQRGPMMTASADDDIRPLREIERDYIQTVLMRLRGNKRLAAARLKIAGTTLYRKMREHPGA
jgi:two-component system response regulator HydG